MISDHYSGRHQWLALSILGSVLKLDLFHLCWLLPHWSAAQPLDAGLSLPSTQLFGVVFWRYLAQVKLSFPWSLQPWTQVALPCPVLGCSGFIAMSSLSLSLAISFQFTSFLFWLAKEASPLPKQISNWETKPPSPLLLSNSNFKDWFP